MSEFVFHPQACADLDDIWEYIAADNVDAADRVREEIYQAIQSLFLRWATPVPISPLDLCVSKPFVSM